MNKPFYVYKITNLVNGKIYIGKSQDGKDRWRTHLNIANGGKSKYPNTYYALHAAINKYGYQTFTFEIIERTITELEALALEQNWIGQLKDSKYILYNLTSGGEGSSGAKRTPETLIKMSEVRQGTKTPSAKLDDDKVKEIKNLLKEEYTIREVSKMFGVSKTIIGDKKLNKRWKHIK